MALPSIPRYRAFLDATGTNPYPLPYVNDPSRTNNAQTLLNNFQVDPAILIKAPAVPIGIITEPVIEVPTVNPNPNTAIVETESGLVPWIKKHPLVTVGIGVGTILLLNELFNKKK